MITNHPVTVMLLIFQESLVVANEHLRFYLLHGLQYYAYDNDQAGTAEGYTCAEHTVKGKYGITDTMIRPIAPMNTI